MPRQSSFHTPTNESDRSDGETVPLERFENQVRETAERLTMITDNMLDLICLTDLHGIIEYMSPSCRTISGHHPQDLIHTNILDYIHPEDSEQVAQAVQDGIRNRSQIFIEFRHRCADDSYKWVETVGNLVYSATGKPVRIVHGTRDITDRKKTEAALKNSEERLKILFELAPDAYYLTDLNGIFIDGNRAAERIIGYRKEELIGRNYFDLNILPPEQLSHALESLEKLRQGQASQPTEFILNHKDGNQVLVEIRSYPVVIDGQPIALGIARDITDRKHAEEILRQAHSKLEQKVRERTINLEEANTALRVLLKGREEDRKTLEEKILSNINELVIPYLERLKAGRLEDRQLGYVEVIESNLNDILSTFAHRLSAHHLKLTPTEIRVANLVKMGRTNKEIAAIAGLSLRTVEGHRNRIRKKMGLSNQKINLRTYLLSTQ